MKEIKIDKDAFKKLTYDVKIDVENMRSWVCPCDECNVEYYDLD